MAGIGHLGAVSGVRLRRLRRADAGGAAGIGPTCEVGKGQRTGCLRNGAGYRYREQQAQLEMREET